MEFLRPGTLAEALDALAEHPDTLPIAGGTDVMVELNLGSHRPSMLMDISHLTELHGWSASNGTVRIGAGVRYSTIVDELNELLPGLAAASRTVGSPQIRNRGTVGGNLGTASPAGDAHPSLLAGGAVVELASRIGSRQVRADEFFEGPGRSVRRADELVIAVETPAARGAAAVRQDRAAERDGDRGVLAGARTGPRAAPRRYRDRVGCADAGPGPRRRGVPGRCAGGAPLLGRWTAARSRRSPGSVSWLRRQRRPSTTSAAAPPTDGTPLRCSPAAS